MSEEYYDLMMDNIDEVAEKWVTVLHNIEKEKLRVSRPYNKRVRPKNFYIGDLVWTVILYRLASEITSLVNGHLAMKGPSES
jgi:hypothetical protein